MFYLCSICVQMVEIRLIDFAMFALEMKNFKRESFEIVYRMSEDSLPQA